jgi:hypothetical protein
MFVALLTLGGAGVRATGETPLQETPLEIHVVYTHYEVDARKLLACFRIEAITDTASAKGDLTSIGRTKLAVSTANVKKVQWERSCQTYFVLWPPSVGAPVRNPCDEFTFKKLADVHDQEVKNIRSLIRSGKFDEADALYREVADEYEQCIDLAPEADVDARFLRFSCLREMCNNAKWYSRTLAFRRENCSIDGRLGRLI